MVDPQTHCKKKRDRLVFGEYARRLVGPTGQQGGEISPKPPPWDFASQLRFLILVWISVTVGLGTRSLKTNGKELQALSSSQNKHFSYLRLSHFLALCPIILCVLRVSELARFIILCKP